jgi:hypothetical protein
MALISDRKREEPKVNRSNSVIIPDSAREKLENKPNIKRSKTKKGKKKAKK